MASQNLPADGVITSDATPKTFNFENLPVRTINRNGEVWFVAADVCAALEVGNPRQAVTRLDDDERDTFRVADSLGRQQDTIVINESGLYALIMTSRKEEAKRFKRWVTHDVLPAIRTTGKYEAKPGRGRRAVTQQARQVPLLPAPRNIRSRDDLSFTKRDAEGRMINWFMPSRANNWHEHYGIGEIWFSEIVELARHNPKEAYHAMRFAGPEMVRYWNYGHPDGFFDRMARWAMAAILANPTEPQLPFDLPCLGIPPREGMDFHLAAAVPRQPLTPAEQDAIDKQAWQEAAECQRHCYERRRYDLMARHA
ncbi:MAG TPA: Bro-N domain-containing protein [Thiomonas arsenitoxydans]|uniref:BRO-N domain-containing protein n=1 Tax=Thiomonas arsenitoxydans (strain DSM 22701 / CIP 110005 / 3As) TaxID=426114 RepID=UPI002CC08F66|nr:Bro-N domain-containing protein [Thiomonas arsenitoxydans]HML83296.1 Bro-N domain-containing protein [Thiomonas arsenitoxydans]